MRRRQKLESAQDLTAKNRTRLWKEVRVVDAEGSPFSTSAKTNPLTTIPPYIAGLSITLDSRPLKTPTKHPLIIPRSKPLLAAAIALEWSLLRSTADALKSYLIPLTQLASRALDLEKGVGVVKREEIVEDLMRYLDTDTLLCFAPTTPSDGRKTLRELQEEAARPVIAFLEGCVWSGVKLVPVDGDVGFAVGVQPAETRGVVKAWVEGLGAWELVGLERAVLASKSLLVAARLVAEWSWGEKRWGVEEAAEAASVEVRFQTGRWGEVEDTHDVEKEDLKRQLGAAVLLVAESR